MKVSKQFILSLALAAAAVTGVATTALAATGTNPPHSSSLVQKIADRFNLNKDEVQKVFDEERAAIAEDREQKLEEKLDQAVADGKLTQEQKTSLMNKINELHNQLRDDTRENRHENRAKLHDELAQWAKDNNIDLDQILPGKRPH